VCVCVCIIYIYIYTHTHTHTYISTHIHLYTGGAARRRSQHLAVHGARAGYSAIGSGEEKPGADASQRRIDSVDPRCSSKLPGATATSDLLYQPFPPPLSPQPRPLLCLSLYTDKCMYICIYMYIYLYIGASDNGPSIPAPSKHRF
jgi:hypothetical protein